MGGAGNLAPRFALRLDGGRSPHTLSCGQDMLGHQEVVLETPQV